MLKNVINTSTGASFRPQKDQKYKNSKEKDLKRETSNFPGHTKLNGVVANRKSHCYLSTNLESIACNAHICDKMPAAESCCMVSSIAETLPATVHYQARSGLSTK